MPPFVTEALTFLKGTAFRPSAIIFLACLVIVIGLPEGWGLDVSEARSSPYLGIVTILSGSATLVFVVEWLWAMAKKFASLRAKPMLQLTVRRSPSTTWWSANTQPNGQTTTQICADIHAFNRTDGDVAIVAMDVCGWRTWFKEVSSSFYTISDPLGGKITSPKHPVRARQLADVRLTVIIQGRLNFQRNNMPLTFVLTDHLGSKIKIRIPLFKV